jgi:aminoglycoside phosphotransferase (APT) family kinase protein
MVTDEQLRAILAHAMPGARLGEAAALGERTLLLALGSRRAVLRLADRRDAWAGDPLAAEAAALRALRAEIDLPLPELLAYDDGAGTGTPYLICSHLEGTPLPELLGELNEDQRYALGRAIGNLLARVHTYAAAAYGPIDPAALPAPRPAQAAGELAEASPADRDYLIARAERGIALALAAGEIDRHGAERLRDGFTGAAGGGQPACLVHGDLRPERVLLRRRSDGWQIAGLVGWGYAQAWRPAWDHVGLLEHFAGPLAFGLRVGYGNAYEERTERPADQLREFALLPYRMLLFLEAGRADLALGLAGQSA